MSYECEWCGDDLSAFSDPSYAESTCVYNPAEKLMEIAERRKGRYAHYEGAVIDWDRALEDIDWLIAALDTELARP